MHPSNILLFPIIASDCLSFLPSLMTDESACLFYDCLRVWAARMVNSHLTHKLKSLDFKDPSKMCPYLSNFSTIKSLLRGFSFSKISLKVNGFKKLEFFFCWAPASPTELFLKLLALYFLSLIHI